MGNVISFLIALTIWIVTSGIGPVSFSQSLKDSATKKAALDSAAVKKQFLAAVDSLRSEIKKANPEQWDSLIVASKQNTENLMDNNKKIRSVEQLAKRTLKVAKANEEKLPEIIILNGPKKPTELPVTIKSVTPDSTLSAPFHRKSLWEKLFPFFRHND